MSKFKVGDLVKVIGNSNSRGFKIGEIVRIIECRSSGSLYSSDYKAAYLDGHDFWYVNGRDLVPYTKEQKQNKYEEKELVWDGKKEKVKFIINDRTTICILPDYTKGIATCHENDNFVKGYGYILAYQRARYNQLYGIKK